MQLLGLFIPLFSGNVDDYGKGGDGPLPLSFLQINGGHPSTSSFAPLRLLPMELVDNILSYLSSEDLKNFAYVDRDCRQLARARLFSFVWLDTGLNSLNLLHQVLKELMEGMQKHALGVCIRR